MTRQSYSSDLSDEEWKRLEPLLPKAARTGRPRQVAQREVVNALLYISVLDKTVKCPAQRPGIPSVACAPALEGLTLGAGPVRRSGCAWRVLPHDFPAWQTVYYYFRFWRIIGVWQRINTALREQVRVQAGRDKPSACIIDSQRVRTTERGGVRGYDGGKKMSGRQRHMLVDTLGLLLRVKVYEANVRERIGVEHLLSPIMLIFSKLRCVWADMAYRGKAKAWLETKLGWQVEIVKRPTKWGYYRQDEQPPPLPGFTALPRRWVVERTFAQVSIVDAGTLCLSYGWDVTGA